MSATTIDKEKLKALTDAQIEKIEATEPFKNLQNDTLDSTTMALTADEKLLTFLDQQRSLFQYQGFNAQALFRILRAAAAQVGKTSSEFRQDMASLCAYYAERGASIVTRGTSTNSKAAARQAVKHLIEVYHVNNNISVAEDQGPNVVTLGRIAATFPEVIGQSMAKKDVGVGDNDIIPKGLMFPAGASLIPKDAEFEYLFNLWVRWAVSFDFTVNRILRGAKNEAFDERASEARARQFGSISRTAGRLDSEDRMYFLLKHCSDFPIGISADTGVTKAAWKLDNKFIWSKASTLPKTKVTYSNLQAYEIIRVRKAP